MLSACNFTVWFSDAYPAPAAAPDYKGPALSLQASGQSTCLGRFRASSVHAVLPLLPVYNHFVALGFPHPLSLSVIP